jgi:hypothetical protein
MRTGNIKRHFKIHPLHSLNDFDLKKYKIIHHNVGDLNPNKIPCNFCPKHISKKHIAEHYRKIHGLGQKRTYNTNL